MNDTLAPHHEPAPGVSPALGPHPPGHLLPPGGRLCRMVAALVALPTQEQAPVTTGTLDKSALRRVLALPGIRFHKGICQAAGEIWTHLPVSEAPYTHIHLSLLITICHFIGSPALRK